MPVTAWVVPIVLEGARVRLEPLSLDHSEALASVAEEQLFRFFAAFRPQSRDVEAADEYIRKVNAESNKVSFAVVDRTTDQAVGATSFMDIREAHRGLEIGSTWLAPSVHGSAVNPEAKLLLLAHAFESLSALRVQFRTDSRNLHSQHAIEKLGALREGVFRRDTVMPDGFVRDTVFYSIVPEEWPSVKAKLLRRLGEFRG